MPDPLNYSRCLAIIMGGGAGSRLYPLTAVRSKPAVPLGGKYRLVDIPISNCINSGLRQVYVLTQFNSASLNRHINTSYRFDPYSGGFVEILAAEQRPDDQLWYQGTADAVRQNFTHLLRDHYDYYIILSGDQLYRMDFRKVLRRHIDTGAKLTITTLPVDRNDAREFGIMQCDASGVIERFIEKPQEDDLLDELRMPQGLRDEFGVEGSDERFQASMGIYVFNREALEESVANEKDTDFGKHVIPAAIKRYKDKVMSYVFQGYWEDIGTIKSFHEANLELCETVPKYDFFDTKAPIYTHARFLPASKVNGANIERAIISDGCILTRPTIIESIIGLRSVVESAARVERTVLMGADRFEDEVSSSEERARPDFVPLGVGEGTRIYEAIIDKNARIGKSCSIAANADQADIVTDYYMVIDGIVVIPKDLIVPDRISIPCANDAEFAALVAANPKWKFPKKAANKKKKEKKEKALEDAYAEGE